jgi:hypothetical protein
VGEEQVGGGGELGDVGVEGVAEPDQAVLAQDQLVAEDEEREEEVEPGST